VSEHITQVLVCAGRMRVFSPDQTTLVTKLVQLLKLLQHGCSSLRHYSDYTPSTAAINHGRGRHQFSFITYRVGQLKWGQLTFLMVTF